MDILRATKFEIYWPMIIWHNATVLCGNSTHYTHRNSMKHVRVPLWNTSASSPPGITANIPLREQSKLGMVTTPSFHEGFSAPVSKPPFSKNLVSWISICRTRSRVSFTLSPSCFAFHAISVVGRRSHDVPCRGSILDSWVISPSSFYRSQCKYQNKQYLSLRPLLFVTLYIHLDENYLYPQMRHIASIPNKVISIWFAPRLHFKDELAQPHKPVCG
jgi:hypothetical protein